MPRLLDSLPGIGEKRAALLKEELGLVTVADLLCFRPRRYIDLSQTQKIFECAEGQYVTVQGVVEKCEVAGFKRRFLEITVFDGTGYLSVVFYGGINFFKNLFTEGTSAIFSGKIFFRKKKILYHPEFDFVEGSRINTGRIIPVYPGTGRLRDKKITSRFFRKIILQLVSPPQLHQLEETRETMPEAVLTRYNLPGLSEAFSNIHFPGNFTLQNRARERLAFDELFAMQLFFKRQRIAMSSCRHVEFKKILIDEYLSRLPFKLTNDQLKAIDEILHDIHRGTIINRLIQGDVGSGKTVVAFAAIFLFCKEGYQSALMAPTEILARQHYELFTSLFADISCALLTGSTPKKERAELLAGLKDGTIKTVIGTHALFQNDVIFCNLSLAVIDEQHRFGTSQRAALRLKAPAAGLIVMSATPIPRSLALALYGDCDISRIVEKPANRLEIETHLFDESRLEGIYRSMHKYISQGRQCYYVLPLIEESEQMEAESATVKFEELKKRFAGISVGLVHGAMSKDEKISVMRDFAHAKVSVLVATTVIEVGIDVPNATVMVIQNAERFGLSQLHQLRGRVGRGIHKSYCILVYGNASAETMSRLSIIRDSNDGFEIAEKDLALRGAGQITGSIQSGFVSDLVFASIPDDTELLEKAKEAVSEFISADQDYLDKGIHISSERVLSLLS